MKSKTLAWAFIVVAFAALIAALSGCRPPEARYITVKVPVAVPAPEPPILPWPELPTQSITADSTEAAVVKAYVATLWLLQGRLAEAYTILNGYRTASQPTIVPKTTGAKQ